MSWTAPRTYVTAELITAAILNTHVRDNFNVVNPAGVTFVLDDGGTVLSSGSKLMWPVPMNCTVSQWDLLTPGQASGLQVEIYAVSYGGFPPTSLDSINSGSPMKTASAVKGQDTNPSAFGALTKGEAAAIVVTGASGITKGFLGLYLSKT